MCVTAKSGNNASNPKMLLRKKTMGARSEGKQNVKMMAIQL